MSSPQSAPVARSLAMYRDPLAGPIPDVRLFVIPCSMAIPRRFQAAHSPGVSIVASRHTLFYHPFISTHAYRKWKPITRQVSSALSEVGVTVNANGIQWQTHTNKSTRSHAYTDTGTPQTYHTHNHTHNHTPTHIHMHI